jgi:hypothetical protein
MNHLSRIRETHSIAAAIRFNNGPRGFVRLVTGPVTLEFQKNLYPACQASAGLIQSSEGELVALRGQAATGVANNEDLKAILQC